MKMSQVLLIESFFSGSHKQLIDLLHSSIPGCEAYTLPGKKWHWKARTSALCLSQEIPRTHAFRVLFASSVLNLAELIALRPDLASLHKVLYFHENQLIYPVRTEKERDFQFGYNQILSSMVADTVLFNSKYNMDSFLDNINTFLKLIPDHRPKNIPESEIVRPKCEVLYFPISFPERTRHSSTVCTINSRKVAQSETYECSSMKWSLSSKCVRETDDKRRENVDSMTDNVKIETSRKDKSGEQFSNMRTADGMFPITSDVKPESLDNQCVKSVVSQVVVSTLDTVDLSHNNVNISTTADQKCEKIDDQDLISRNNDKNDSQQEINLVNIDTKSDLSECKSTDMELDVDNDVNAHTDSVETHKYMKHGELRTVDKIQSLDTDSRSIAIGRSLNTDSRTVTMQQTLDTWEEYSCPAKQSRMSTQKESLHIVWPHRWEHDKDPEMFFRVMIKLHEEGLDFRLSVLGETFHEVPGIFEKCLPVFGKKIIHWGYQTSKQDYYDILSSADCIVSTAKHEFFGVAMLEAVHLGCYPVCPNKLVYPEIFPKDCLYNTEIQLYKKLKEMCRKPYIVRNKHIMIDTNQYSWEVLKAEFYRHLKVDEYS